MVLPITALILISLASYTRYMRGSMLEVMNFDYIRTARAKGMPERTVVMRHGFRNALIPIATLIPLDLAALFGGAIITETVFGWSGMGRLFVDALDIRERQRADGLLPRDRHPAAHRHHHRRRPVRPA